MKILWGIGSLVATGWAVSWIATADSWWRLLVVLAVSLSVWRAIGREWFAASLCLLVAAGVLFKVLLVGADQRAGLGDWAPSSVWEQMQMAAWLGVAILSLRVSLEAVIAFALTGICFQLIWLIDVVGLHIATEVFVLLGLGSIAGRLDGQVIGVGQGNWRSSGFGQSIGWLGRCGSAGDVHGVAVQEEK